MIITLMYIFLYSLNIFYTSEDLKWNAPKGVILNRYWYMTLDELKCPILG